MFLRYQEYYESPNPHFRGKNFEILEFMEWYSKKHGNGVFTYPADWGGFNIPAHVIPNLWKQGIWDRNLYDYEMWTLYEKCLKKYTDGQFYFIGVSGDGQAIRHEIAHGFFIRYQNTKNR